MEGGRPARIGRASCPAVFLSGGFSRLEAWGGDAPRKRAGRPPSTGYTTFRPTHQPIVPITAPQPNQGLVTNCGRCHASGGLPNFASANAALGYDEAFDERDEIVSEIRRGSMPADTCNGPPGSNGCVSVADFNLIQQWVAAGAPE